MMTAENALRFVAHEARQCRDRDTAEALCLLMPSLLAVLKLPLMEDGEARAFSYALRERFTMEAEKPWELEPA